MLTMVSGVEGIRRIRFMTSHPKDLSDEMIKAMAKCRMSCHHVHAFQIGTNEIRS
jgi:tRNA-2-methylthio-N6-dimethylallyladenosine synthase